MNLASRVAIVTGSGRGIGRAIALRLSQAGAAVAVSDIDPASAGQTAKDIEALGGRVIAAQADVTSPADTELLITQASRELGRVDVLVNNAGITRDGLLMRMSDEDWDRVLQTNLKGAFLCSRAALRPMLRQRWGRIINIASVVGLIGNAGQANYAAAKAGLIGFTRSLAREVATRGVTVNAIAPGFIDTDMTRRLAPEWKEALLKQIPLGAFGTPEDVAEAVLFLASEQARYITGHVLNVDGGMAMG
jgi:3-oxoacyl-[acyl-carrier protein] reductase